MALHFSSACFSAFSRSKVPAVRAVASDQGSVAVRTAEEEKVKLGGSELKVTSLGIGAWSWGDTSYWNNFDWDDRKLKAAKAAFDTSIDCGITFFDTAEVYGSRMSLGAISSETLLGSVISALKDSLSRLELSCVDLYQLHCKLGIVFPGYIDGLADAVEQGLVKAVGVSNYSEKRLRAAYDQLKKRGIPLASNQVNYSLIYRLPEENGVKSACDELGVTLIAYSPLAQGALTGKYTPNNTPSGPRGQIYTPEFMTKLQPLISRIKEIGKATARLQLRFAFFNCCHVFYTFPLLHKKFLTKLKLAKVHLFLSTISNDLRGRAQLANCSRERRSHPGARNGEQAKEFAGAVGWRLSNDEVEELRSVASEIKRVVGFPVEKL
ncbi:UNVERIFIED_CONTAM: putative oxidoreductase, chloroplastic [Sesamum radiatum]|uniref:Oxidoreductase, chloroplastic n=1 Tax=Sesamum radiatum TaxID=300843 RepID=A0AAW2T5Q7_SESRA